MTQNESFTTLVQWDTKDAEGATYGLPFDKLVKSEVLSTIADVKHITLIKDTNTSIMKNAKHSFAMMLETKIESATGHRIHHRMNNRMTF